MYMFTYFSKKLTFKNPYVILFQRVYILPLRNENVGKHAICYHGKCVYILPLRNENLCPQKFIHLLLSVYILPLRNENWKISHNPPWFFICLYPTFKEWKLNRQDIQFFACYCVYILPLRNENDDEGILISFTSLCLYPTFKEWKRRWRNSNFLYIALFISYL